LGDTVMLLRLHASIRLATRASASRALQLGLLFVGGA
jgi:hypothetical protein